MLIHSHGTGIQKGLTVLELMVTLSIATILLATGIPSLQQFTHRQHMKSAVTSLHQDLLLARSQSVYRNAIIVACPGNPADGCTGDSNWSEGWIVFEDENPTIYNRTMDYEVSFSNRPTAFLPALTPETRHLIL